MASIKSAPDELRRAQLVYYLSNLATRRIYSKSGKAAVQLTEKGRPWFGLDRKSVSGTITRVLALGPGIIRSCNGKRTTEIRLTSTYTPTEHELRFGALMASLPDWVDFDYMTETDLRIIEFLRQQDSNEFGVDKGTISTTLPKVAGFEDLDPQQLTKRFKALQEIGALELLPPGVGKHHYVKLIRLLDPFTIDFTKPQAKESSQLEELLAEEAKLKEKAKAELPEPVGELDYDKLAKSLLLEALHAVANKTSPAGIEDKAKIAQLKQEGEKANEVIKDLGIKLYDQEAEILTLRQLVENQRAEIKNMERQGYRIKDLVSDPERAALDRLMREAPMAHAV